MNEVMTTQVMYPFPFPVDDIVDLLRQPVCAGSIHYEFGEDFVRFTVVQHGFQRFYPRGIVPENHGQAGYDVFSFGKFHEEVLYSYFQLSVDAFREGFIVFVRGIIGKGIEHIGGGEKNNPAFLPGGIGSQFYMGVYLGFKISSEGGDDIRRLQFPEQVFNCIGLYIEIEKMPVVPETSIGKIGAIGIKIGA